MKWVVIQSNLALFPTEPVIDVVETPDIKENDENLGEVLDLLIEQMDDLERNDCNIQAVPYDILLQKIKSEERR